MPVLSERTSTQLGTQPLLQSWRTLSQLNDMLLSGAEVASVSKTAKIL